MYILQDFLELMDVVPEYAKIHNALKEIKNIAEKMDENNFESQSKLIAEICDEASKNKPKIISKNKSDLIEDYEYHIESLISGEYLEQFQV